MNLWENWTFSAKTGNRLNELGLKLDSEEPYPISKDWLELFHYSFSEVLENYDWKMETDCTEADSSKEKEIITLFRESIEANTTFPEIRLTGISYNSLNRVLLSVKNILREEEFPTFCRFISSWNDSTLIELSLKSVILPKLKEKNELSAYMMFSLKELANSKPGKLCHNVLIPILSDYSFHFTDAEVLSNVYLALEPAQQDLVILTLTKKEDFKESDWLLLQPLVKNLSHNSVKNILNCIYKFSTEFERSQVFGKFLVNFCKNLNFIHDKKLLVESIKKHQTLLKRQALKYLESM